MTWSLDETQSVAEAYYADYVVSRAADPSPREVRNQHRWAVERVLDASMDGTLPLRAVDALFRAGETDEGYLGYVAAGPVEDLLSLHGDKYDAEVAARCQADCAWAEAARGVWVDRERWEGLPPALQQLVPEPERPRSKAQKTRRRPSRRQG